MYIQEISIQSGLERSKGCPWTTWMAQLDHGWIITDLNSLPTGILNGQYLSQFLADLHDFDIVM
jgi:hypothetical protein